MTDKTIPSYDYLHQLLSYDPSTGILKWKPRDESMFLPGNTSVEANCSSWNKKYAGKPAGTITKDPGYVVVTIDYVRWRAHRLAWVMMTGGDVPNGFEIDHLDRVRTNNAWDNLRLVSRSQNNMNASLRSDNNSGHRGVGQRKDNGSWYARIKVGGKLHLLGHFNSFEEARNARLEAEKVHFGVFSSTRNETAVMV